MTSILKLVSDTLLMSNEELLAFALTAPHRYKKYYIKKRSGNGLRLIAQPSKETKFIQRIVADELRKHLPVHSAALAYEKYKGIRLNAMHHKDNAYLLKMDFSDFFPSITPRLFFSVAAECGVKFSSQEKLFLSRILFFRATRQGALRLSIGAPSSPFLSNFVMCKFDAAMMSYCIERKIIFTRYADDITFSTNVKGALFEVPSLVAEALSRHTCRLIKLNPGKTVWSSKAFNRHVTGVVLTNAGSLSLGYDKKRLYSSMIHKFSLGLLDEEKRLHLKGLLAHSLYIEPDFVSRMRRKYSEKVINDVFK